MRRMRAAGITLLQVILYAECQVIVVMMRKHGRHQHEQTDRKQYPCQAFIPFHIEKTIQSGTKVEDSS